MLKIGEFSLLAKLTIKTLQYYDEIGLFKPSFIGYERKGTIKGFSDLFGFVLESWAKAKEVNPTIECGNYCYINYLDNEYKDKDINIAYVEETLSMGKENDEIKFKQFPEEKLLSLKYVGGYSHLRDAYKELLKYIKDNNITTKSSFREVYVDGCWNKDNEDEYLTLIEVVID